MLPSLNCHSCSQRAIIAVVTMLSLPHLPCHHHRTVASSPHCCIVAALLHRRSHHTVVVTAVTVVITAVTVHQCCCCHIVVAAVAIPFLSQSLCRSHHALMPLSLHHCCRSFHAVMLPQFSCHRLFLPTCLAIAPRCVVLWCTGCGCTAPSCIDGEVFEKMQTSSVEILGKSRIIGLAC